MQRCAAETQPGGNDYGNTAALDAARAVGWSSIVSARSGETEDVTIVHLAVGWAAGQLKVGSCARSSAPPSGTRRCASRRLSETRRNSGGCRSGHLCGRKANLEQETRRSGGVIRTWKNHCSACWRFFLSRRNRSSRKTPLPDQLRPSSWRERFSSPRIEALQKEIASGRTTTDAFWSEVTKEGTPLIEPSNERDKHQLVTFLWRGTPETRSVLVVIDPFTAARPQDYVMRRVERSDVWHLTVRMPRDARFIYRVSVNDQTGPGFFGDLKLDAAVADPLNRNSWLGHSAVELPGAPPQPWITRTSGTPEGKIERHRIASIILNNERDIWVYTPARYGSDSRPNSLLVLFDGLANIQLLSVPVILDNLIEASRVPATLRCSSRTLVGIACQSLTATRNLANSSRQN